MSKRVPSVALVLVLGLLVAACASSPPTAQQVKTSFVPQTVDFLDDVGRGASIALDADGNPHIAYIGLIAALKEGDIPPAHAASAPALPAVLTASQKEGIFSHGYVIQTDITSSEATVVPLTSASTTGIAVGAKGSENVVWNQSDGVYFATAPNDLAPFGEPQQVTKEAGLSPVVAVDANDVPWVAWVQPDAATAGAISLQAATLDGDKWTAEQVADLGACDPAPCPPITLGIAEVDGSPVVAYTDSGGNVSLAKRGGTSWTTERVASGEGALGASLAVAKDGTMHVSFATTDGKVRHAAGSGGSWTVSDVGSYSPPETTPTVSPSPAAAPNEAPTAASDEAPVLLPGTSVGVDQDKGNTLFVAWTDPTGRAVRLAQSTDGTSFDEVDTPGTEEGEMPALAVRADGEAELAWYDAQAEDLLLGGYPEKLGGVAVPAPSTPYTPPQGGTSAGCAKDTVEFVAPPGAGGSGFSPDTVEAPSGDFTACFDNQDPGQTHNVEIFQSEADAQGGAAPLAGDDTFAGPKTDTFEVKGLAAGDYFFHCIVHAATMTGTLTVK